MNAMIRTTGALLLSMGLLVLGNGLQSSLISLRASLEGFSTQFTGILMTGYFIGFLAGSTLTPRIVAQVGHIRVFAALASLASSVVLIYAVFTDPWLWFGMRVVTGFCIAGLFIVAESWLNDSATNATRGQLLSLYMVITSGAMACGQLLLNLADPGSFELFILIAVLVSLALLPILLSATSAPSFAAPVHISLLQLYRSSPLGILGCMGTGMSNGAMLGMGVIYAEQMGLSLHRISLFMGLLLVGGMVLQWPIGKLSDRFDRRMVIFIVTALAALTSLLAAAIAEVSTVAQLSVAFLLGGLAFPMYSLCVAYTNDALEPRQMVAASSNLVLAYGIGAALGPSLVAAVMGAVGPAGFFWYLAVVHAAIGVFALYRMTRRNAVPMDEQGLCVPVGSAASQVAMAMVQEATVDQANEAPEQPVCA
ncbi:MAG: MFS transporter [Pseudomonas sp.]